MHQSCHKSVNLHFSFAQNKKKSDIEISLEIERVAGSLIYIHFSKAKLIV